MAANYCWYLSGISIAVPMSMPEDTGPANFELTYRREGNGRHHDVDHRGLSVDARDRRRIVVVAVWQRTSWLSIREGRHRSRGKLRSAE
jgi:hypothetical protein